MIRRLLPLAAAVPFIGCAAHKNPVPGHPAAAYTIPVECIDRVLHGTDKTKCYALDPAHPDTAVCGPVVVHFTCTKVATSK
jgi:hypothetical protein